jgi:hypothetical protein
MLKKIKFKKLSFDLTIYQRDTTTCKNSPKITFLEKSNICSNWSSNEIKCNFATVFA